MTAPVRLLDSSRNPRARELLRAGIADGPKPSALRAAALALGVGASVTATATAAAATTSGLATPSLALIAAKWIAIGTLGGVALAGSASAVSALASGVPEAPPATTAARAATPSQLETLPGPPVEAAPARPPTPSVSTAPTPIASAPRAVFGTNEAPPSALANAKLPARAALPEGVGLAAEIAKIDGARRALAANDAAGALRQLTEFDAVDRTGTLAREAQLLRIEALVRAGDRARSRALADEYLARHPRDPHAARLRALLADRLEPARTMQR